MHVPAKKKQRFQVGDRVRFRLGTNLISGPVVEDLGNIGVGGDQIVRVQVHLEETDPRPFEISAELLTLLRRRRAAA
jgi:Ni,Fe-hydrogenase III small subunit